MTLAQFLRLNFGDAERRLARLTAPDVDDQAALWTMLNDSTPGRALTALATASERAAPESRGAQAWRKAAAAWLDLPPVLRMRSIGAVALTASLVHVGLTLAVQPVGWWWLIVPAMVAAFGGAALILSWSATPPAGERP